MAYIFDATKGETAESLARRRAMVQALTSQDIGTPRTIGDGIAALGKGLAGYLSGKALARQEKAGAEGAAAKIASLLGSMSDPSAFPAAPGASAQPMDYASQRVAQAHGDGEIETYIRQAAAQRGIDPDIAVRVAMSEGGLSDPVRQSDVVKGGVREQSFGPFQLYMGGGLGNEFQQATGLHPSDPSAWQKGVDFALDKAKQGGWGPWYGAAKAGIGNMDGIGGQQMAQAAQPGMDQLPPTAGGTAGTFRAGSGPTVQALMAAVSDPYLSESQRGIVNMLLQRALPEPQKPTDDIREYEFARSQGFTGSLQDWIISGRRAGADNITVGGGKYGTIPAGFMLQETPEGARLVPIPGGPAAVEAAAAEEANRNRESATQQRSGLVAEEIDRVLERMEGGILPDTGIGAALSGIPGTDAKAVSSLLETIKANIGFDELNKMRQQSKTGGALGNVTEKELSFLQSVAGSLDQSQDADQLRYNLNRLWNGYMDVIHGEGQGPKRRELKGASAKGSRPLSEMSDEELEAIINGR